MPEDLTDLESILVQVMARCPQVTSHYLSQCWARFLSPYHMASLGHNELRAQNTDLYTGLGSIPFFQFNSNSSILNSNSTAPNKFQFQFQFQTFQFQFQFRRIQIQSQFQKWPVDVFVEIDFDYNNKVHVYKIIVINTISLISIVKWL